MKVRALLETEGVGRVLVVDGGGSLRSALLGDVLAGLGVANGWAGVVVFGCVRDTEQMAGMDIGIRALAAYPTRSEKHGVGHVSVPVTFGGITIRPDDWLYADADGIVVSEQPIHD